jgi:hypothetical protein
MDCFGQGVIGEGLVDLDHFSGLDELVEVGGHLGLRGTLTWHSLAESANPTAGVGSGA